MNNSFLLIALLTVTALSPARVFGSSPQDSVANDKLSRAYSKAAFMALVEIHRWKEEVRRDAKGSVINPTFGKHLKSAAYEDLRISQTAAENDADRKSGDILQRLFENVGTWSTRMAEARANLNASYSINPDAVDKDADLLRIDDCEKGVNAMLASGRFQDIAVCR
jgi:hypothetical protein